MFKVISEEQDVSILLGWNVSKIVKVHVAKCFNERNGALWKTTFKEEFLTDLTIYQDMVGERS